MLSCTINQLDLIYICEPLLQTKVELTFILAVKKYIKLRIIMDQIMSPLIIRIVLIRTMYPDHDTHKLEISKRKITEKKSQNK